MKSHPTRHAGFHDVAQTIIGPWSLEFPTSSGVGSHGTPLSSAWFSANDPVALPFRLSHGGVVTQLGWVNGTAAGGNVDVGIYSDAWVRLVSTGSTLGSGNSLPQWVDVADTALAPGRLYYLACSRDNTTANRARTLSHGGAAVTVALAGVQDSATNAFPLPDPLTNMAAAATITYVPILLVAFRTPF